MAPAVAIAQDAQIAKFYNDLAEEKDNVTPCVCRDVVEPGCPYAAREEEREIEMSVR